MDKDSKFTKNSEGYTAVRVVSGTEALPALEKDSMFARDTNGNISVRVVGAGDQHNLGWYSTPEALAEAHATAEAGDWAIVGSTDTVWIWDTDTSAWADSDTKGQVTSVNNQTGAVTVQETLVSGTNIKTINGSSVLGSGDITTEVIQLATLPTASVDEEGNIYQFVGTTDANYTNGYFYKCVSDGLNPATYSWAQVSVQPAPEKELPTQAGNSGKYLKTNGTSASWENVGSLPDQTGQSGKFLTTDGTDASWATISALQNNTTATDALAIGPSVTSTQDYSVVIGNNITQNPFGGFKTAVLIGSKITGSNYFQGVAICPNSNGFTVGLSGAVAIGRDAFINGDWAIAIGEKAQARAGYAISLGFNVRATASGAIQIGYHSGSGYRENSDANTVKISNENGNYMIMDANGNLPADRLASTSGLADGNYRLRLTMAGGVPTLSWVAE